MTTYVKGTVLGEARANFAIHPDQLPENWKAMEKDQKEDWLVEHVAGEIACGGVDLDIEDYD